MGDRSLRGNLLAAKPSRNCLVYEGESAGGETGGEPASPRDEHLRGSPLTLTAKDVAEIMRVLEESTFDSLSLEMDGVKLKLQRGSAVSSKEALHPAPPQA